MGWCYTFPSILNRTIRSFRYLQRYSLSESSAKFNVRIYKSPNHNELCVKRQNNDDVDSMDGENDEDLTYLTLLNRVRITKF